MNTGTYTNKEIVILGAGLVGSMLAIVLSQKGYNVSIFEKRSDPRISNYLEGRSINLALSDRGLKALAMAGLSETVLHQAVAMKGRMVHEINNELHFHPYGEEGKVIYSISRSELNKVLIDQAEKYKALVFFEHTCKKVLLEKKLVELEAGNERQFCQYHYDFIFGADGAFSKLRNETMSRSRFNYSQQYINYGYKELSIPAFKGEYLLEKNALHIWPRGEFMLIALPNINGSFTCTLFLPFEGENSFDSLSDSKALHNFFQHNFTDCYLLFSDLEYEFFSTPASSMVTVECSPWVYNLDAALIGDAAHAIVPFFGQGMNAGFEDVSCLSEFLDQGLTLQAALSNYNDTRKLDTDAISQLALNNFIEMRDLVSDENFILRKKIEGELHKNFPEYASLYSMVTFSNIPYNEAFKNGQQQNEMFNEILKLENINEIWNTEVGWNNIAEIYRRYNQI